MNPSEIRQNSAIYDILEKIVNRRSNIPKQDINLVNSEQGHLTPGEKQAYWNHGYDAALKDVIDKFTASGLYTPRKKLKV